MCKTFAKDYTIAWRASSLCGLLGRRGGGGGGGERQAGEAGRSGRHVDDARFMGGVRANARWPCQRRRQWAMAVGVVAAVGAPKQSTAGGGRAATPICCWGRLLQIVGRLVRISTAIRAKGAAGRPERAGGAVASAEAKASRCCADCRSSAGFPPKQTQCSHTGSLPRLLRCRLLRHRPATWRGFCSGRAAAASQLDLRH